MQKTNWELRPVPSAIFINLIQVTATERCWVFVLFPRLSLPASSIQPVDIDQNL